MERTVDVLSDAVSLLQKSSSFCASHSELCNVHTVDFITHQKWDILPSQLKQELYVLNFEQLQSLTNIDTTHGFHESDFPHLTRFLSDAKAHTLEALKICISLSTLLPSFPKTGIGKKSPYWCMSPKKDHEVEILALVVSLLAAKNGIKMVLDVGSGKGYLSSYLALEHGLNVLALDNSSQTTVGADERNKKVMYFRSRSHKKSNMSLDIKPDTSSCSVESAQNSETCFKSSPNNVRKSASSVNLPGIFVSRTHHINDSSDLNYLINDFLVLQNEDSNSIRKVDCDSGVVPVEDQVLLCSLHGCGNLSATLLKLFLSTHQVKVLCSVGCCYHLVEEIFFKSPFTSHGDKEAQEFGFPLSSILVENGYCLGRNARMLASQSIERISKKKAEPEKALYYRALLQVILKDKLNESSHIPNVGHVATKKFGFSCYVQKALKKLKLDHLQVSESEIDEYLVKYSEEEKKLYAFQQLRIIMAPCIEALILLDRLVFLLEQEVVQEAHIVRLFDPVTSPRCFGIIAWK